MLRGAWCSRIGRRRWYLTRCGDGWVVGSSSTLPTWPATWLTYFRCFLVWFTSCLVEQKLRYGQRHGRCVQVNVTPYFIAWPAILPQNVTIRFMSRADMIWSCLQMIWGCSTSLSASLPANRFRRFNLFDDIFCSFDLFSDKGRWHLFVISCWTACV